MYDGARMYQKVKCAVNVDYAVKHALNDMASLARAELPAERLVEHCIYRYFGSQTEVDMTQHLGYGKDSAYLTDAELDNYQHDCRLLYETCDRLMVLLDPHLKYLREMQRPPIDVLVAGHTAYLLF